MTLPCVACDCISQLLKQGISNLEISLRHNCIYNSTKTNVTTAVVGCPASPSPCCSEPCSRSRWTTWPSSWLCCLARVSVTSLCRVIALPRHCVVCLALLSLSCSASSHLATALVALPHRRVVCFALTLSSRWRTSMLLRGCLRLLSLFSQRGKSRCRHRCRGQPCHVDTTTVVMIDFITTPPPLRSPHSHRQHHLVCAVQVDSPSFAMRPFVFAV